MTTLRPDFLWGASTAPHQIEGNNINSDWWVREESSPGMQLSGDAVDSYHRYREDMQLLADAGCNSYRFGVEWARIEPRPGHFSRAELAHYRRMIETAIELGLTPVVTLHHFSSPRWFADRGGWTADGAIDHFRAYVTEVASILGGVEWVATINEPNMLAMMEMLMDQMKSGEASEWKSPTVEAAEEGKNLANNLPVPHRKYGEPFVEAHHAAREVLHELTDAKVGWTVASAALTPTPGNEEKFIEVQYDYENLYLEAARGDDFIGVQSYSSQAVDASGLVPHPPHPDNTMVGTAYRPDALGMAVRHAWEVTEGVPVLVTENGLATTDDERRIAYTQEALGHLIAASEDGVDVRGYLHWTLLDNYEWGHWEPTFGLVGVDRETFVRTPKPSLGWLGNVARLNGANILAPASTRP
ncbi:family 1 glycosylhydrolase [Arthrobacter sp. efr-133-TYG-118]|uniref:glycoside hydrolase family 1 protein n=1 Tax=Arthrobacter sp. efr-133-TYG-118 TaxID=3040279 RepID=UPI00255077C8|nr:family 1 glycosylhydrolase [Arthrobacter sp. efr-133-TYG-118]